MKLKNKLILLGILTGVISCFGLNNSQAAEITSIFSGETITRETVANLSTISELDNSIGPITLGISKSEYKTNDGDGKYFYWTIKDSNGEYKDLYCLNLARGFGNPDGNITNSNSTKNYTNEYDLNILSNQNYTAYTGLTTANKNKILWILNHSLTSKEDSKTILTAASQKVDGDSVGLPSITSFVKEDMISNTRASTKLTFSDIKMIQQIAIWHYTNPGSIFDNTIESICNSSGNQISGLWEENILVETDTHYGPVRNGLVKQAKINALYQYFIDGAESETSGTKTPTLKLSNTNAKVVESGDNYIVGPFYLEETNKELIKNITANVNVDYKLLNSSKVAVANDDFSKVVGSNFYLEVPKSKITQSTNITINLTYKYDQKELTLLTNASDAGNTQPVVLVGSAEKDPSVKTNATIELTSISVEKVWSDSGNQDRVRPTSVKVQLYKDGIAYENSITLNNSNSWNYTWANLLDGYEYAVKELNSSGSAVANGGKYNNDYTATYQISGNKTIVTNTHTPEKINISGTKTWLDYDNQDGMRPEEIKVNLFADGEKIDTKTVKSPWKYSFTNLPKYKAGKEITYTIDEEAIAGYTKSIVGYNITNTQIPLKPDLALRKYITSINGVEITSENENYRVPQIDTGNLNDNNTQTTTARYVHKKNPIQVNTGDKVIYNITIYNEGEKDARASKIIDQLPTELKYIQIKTDGYTGNYNKDTNRLIITKEETNNLTAYTKNGELSSETIQVECEVIAEVNEENKILTNIAWISEMKDANNNTFENDIDSNVKDMDSKYNKDNMSNYQGKENDNGYYKGQQDDDDFDRLILLSQGILDIQIQKIDENRNIITSSEAEFEIKGTQNLKDTTNKGVLDLNSQKLIGNTFEYIYTIKETKTPIGYNGISEELSVKISGTTKLENESYVIDTIDLTDKDGNELDSSKILAEYNSDLNKVVIKIVNTKISNEYTVNLLKVEEKEDGTIAALDGAWFKVNDGQEIQVAINGNRIDTNQITSEGELELTYELEETREPAGYIKIAEPKTVKIKAKVELVDNKYEITQVNLVEEIDEITISEENNVITIKVKNEPKVTGKYNVILRKVDENGNILPGSKFEIKTKENEEEGKEYDLVDGEVTLLENMDLFSTDSIELYYNLNEIKVPTGYTGIENTKININAEVEKEGSRYYIKGITSTFDGEENPNVNVTLRGNTILISVKNTPIEEKFDLALRKFITKINDETYSREPVVDTSKLGTVVDGKKVTTATYKHSKEPIAVQKGDIITYTIRVYNEGEIAGYVDKITDYLPDHLLPIITGVDGIDEEKYVDEIEFNLNWGWIVSEDGKTVVTTKTSKLNSETYSLLEGFEDVTDTKLEAYVEGSNKLDYIDVQIKCLVTDSAVGGEYLTNIAEITDSQDINGNKSDGFDSELNNVDHSNLSDYKNNEAISSTTESYVPGQEDDDDFEKLVVKEFDLSLRKFITKVNETTHSREPKVDTSKLGTIVNGKTITTATYIHTKEPVIVETSDLVTYKIRIYNEGTIAGFANEITDDIPAGLEFLPNSDINVSYRWKMLDKDGKETEDVSKAVMITTDYLSNRDSNNIIREVSEVEGAKTLNYKDVEVQFKVIAKAEKLKDNIIINEAQISADSDRDIDSVPNRDEKYDYDTGKNEDDIDYEPIKLQYFDLALRKFITKVNNTDYNNRYPEIKFNNDGSITYNHTKDPVLVTTGDTVIYTIRVYNEGEKAGYATEIKDNLPEGLAFDPNNATNKAYGWKMIDKDGNVTEEAEKVVAFKTNHLENEKIDALVEVNGSKVLSYKDVQIAFVVTESNMSDRILVNTAQISADSDDDIDSTPDNSIESEDDIDKEYVKVEYFDLALKKWVTETRVTLDGKTTNTKTGFTEDSTGIAKVDIVASKLKKTTVKFVYNIKVTNEGELPGYAYEIKDYIPNGLKFVAEDNKDWKEEKDGTVVTDKLKDTLLNPGESATVEIVLTWKNSSTNLGVKTNYAEISNDSGDDIDSTPDNYDFTEDDIDDAQVILSIKTAGKTTYIGLVLISIAILAGGIFLIKKYVLN